MRVVRTLEEIKAYYGNLKATHATYVPDMEVNPKTLEIWKLLDHIATLQAQNAALQARADALGEWQGVEVAPTEDIERCFLRLRALGYKSYYFGSYSSVNGWHWLAQYGDGSEYPEPIDKGAWDWLRIPDESPTAAV